MGVDIWLPWVLLSLVFVCELVIMIVLIIWFIEYFQERKSVRREDRKWKEHEAMQLIRGTITPFIGLINAAEKQRDHSTEGHG